MGKQDVSTPPMAAMEPETIAVSVSAPDAGACLGGSRRCWPEKRRGSGYPPYAIPDMLAGRTYLELATIRFPSGEIRRQLMDDPVISSPTGLTVLEGEHTAGWLYELQSGDDQYLSLRLRPSRYRVDLVQTAAIELEGIAGVDDPWWLRFDVQTNAGGVPGLIRQRILLFHFACQRWTLMHDQFVEPTDHTLRVETRDWPGRFIEDGTLRVLARIRWDGPRPNLSSGTQVSVDQARWQTLH
ncbi:MAG: hypothetical protein AB1486_11765 [Planctomycetota bacterium]